MRGVAIFALGVLAGGIAVHAAVAQSGSLSPNHGIIGLNHVAISVPDTAARAAPNPNAKDSTCVVGMPLSSAAR